jgi:spore maturation protein CgeB
MKKIVVLGNHWHGNWSHTLTDELKATGYQSEHVNVRYERKFRINLIESFRKKVFFARLEKTLIKKFLTDKEIDRVIAITAYGVPVEVWKAIHASGIRLIGWWGDDPTRKGKLTESMQYFDKIFLVDESWIKNVREFNPHIYFLPNAGSEKNFYPIPTIEKKYDVSFIGDSFGGAKDGKYRAELVEYLAKNKIKVALFGDTKWKVFFHSFPLLKNIFKGPIDSPHALNELYNQSKIVLNIHHSQLHSGTNQKTFEVALAGGFQIADYIENIKNEFGDTVALFRSKEELLERVTYFLSHEEERATLAKESREIALKNDTYQKRIEILLGD